MNAYKWKQTNEDAVEERHDVVSAYLCVRLNERKETIGKEKWRLVKKERGSRRGIRKEEAEWNKVGREE